MSDPTHHVERTRLDPFREKLITHNEKLLAMRELAARSCALGRGDLVTVWPSRGEPFAGLVVDVDRHTLYGVVYEVLHHGAVHRHEAERISPHAAVASPPRGV